MEGVGPKSADVSPKKVRRKKTDGANDSTKRSRLRRNPVIEFFTSKRTKLTLCVIFAVLSVVCALVLIDYLKNGAIDQSIVNGNSIAAIADSGQEIQNAGGPFGAWLANILLVHGLGVGAFVLVIYFAVLSLALYGIMRCRFWAFTFKCLFTAISLSVIFGLFTYNVDTAFHWGGDHGRYINQWLITMSGLLGAYGVSFLLIGLLIVLYLPQIQGFVDLVTSRLRKSHEEMESAETERREILAELADVPEVSNIETASVLDNSSADLQIDDISADVAGFAIDDEPSSAETDIAKSEKEPEFTINVAELGENSTIEVGDVSELPPLNIRDELSHYRFPGTDLLIDRPIKTSVDSTEQQENKDLIVKTLKDYGIPISRIEATIGPTVTLYEIVPAEGVRIAQIKRLEDDIALSLAALGIRIIAPIPGKGTVGIEVPNRDPQTVSMFSVINSRKFRECKLSLPIALGATINNDVFIEDLSKMPHLLVAGATGMGKSVGLNCIIASLLYKKHPGELKFVLIDPKMVEFSLYSRLEQHYLAKLPEEDDAVVTDSSKALATLSSLCIEMDQRYELLKSAGVRNVLEYNTKFTQRRLNPEKGHRYMPYIVAIVDEFADLIMTAGKDISQYIARIAQKARAVGIHMIIATQRPSTDVITGMIKANFPARIAFRCSQMVDSKTILDRPGANRLIGRGDLLFSCNNKLERVQCAFIDTPEVEGLVDFISRQTGYGSAYLLPEPVNENALAVGAIDLSKRDELFDDCARFVVQNPTASTSSLQRRFGIGYNKAGKIMDQLEAAGVVGPADGQRPRTVLVDSITIEDILRAL